MSKPGIMFYFSTRPCLKRLSLEEKGLLFEALLDYGEFGAVPTFDESPGLAVAWDFMQQLVDRDAERYGVKVMQRRYATFCREAKKRGEAVIPFDDWAATEENEAHHSTSNDVERHPITISNSIPISKSVPVPNSEQVEKSPTRSADFDQFWSAYPKRVGKQAALRAFRKVKVPIETVLTAIEQQKHSSQWTRDNGQYIPNPAIWLNQGRWEDELEPSKADSKQFQNISGVTYL